MLRLATSWKLSCLLLLSLGFVQSLKAQDEPHLYPILKEDKLGFIDVNGIEIVRPQFDRDACSLRMLPQFREGLARVVSGGGLGYIDRTGKLLFVLAPQSVDPVQSLLGDARAFREGIAVARRTGNSASRTPDELVWFDRNGRVVFAKDGDQLPTEFHEGLLRLSQGQYWGYVDHKFQWVIRPQFQSAEDFSEGLALVRIVTGSQTDWAYIDKTGAIIFKGEGQYLTASSFSDGLARINVVATSGPKAHESWFEFVDHTGHVVIRPNLQSASFFFSEGFAFGCTDCAERRMAIIDKHGKQVTPSEFDAFISSEFHERRAAIRKGNVFGYIDPAGLWVIPPQFDEAYNFSNGLALVVWREKHEWAYIDRNGRTVWKGIDRCQYPAF